MKKILSLLSLMLVIVMLAASAVPAFAENEAAETVEEADFVRFTSTTNFDPYGTFSFSPNGNNTEIDADVVRYAAIRYRMITEDNEEGIELGAQFYVMTPKEPYIPVVYEPTKTWNTVIVDMTSVSVTKEGADSIWNSDNYSNPTMIRFDPMEPNRENPNFDNDNNRGHVRDQSEIDIAWVAFFENEEDAKAYTGKENTPYCYIDADCLENYVASNNMKASRYKNNEKEEKFELDEIVVNKKGATSDAVLLSGRTLGIHTPVIPDGFVLHDLILTSCPTWNQTEDCDALAEVYIWKGDYDETLEHDPITSFEVLNHRDNSPAKFTFDTALRYGYSYLIMISPSNTGAFGFWTGEEIETEGWEVWLDDIEEEINVPPISYTLLETGELPDFPPEPTKAPTAEPTEIPEVTEAPATDAPEATTAPAEATKAPEKDNGAKAEKKDSNVLPIVIGAVVAAAVIAAVVIIIAKKKKK